MADPHDAQPGLDERYDQARRLRIVEYRDVAGTDELEDRIELATEDPEIGVASAGVERPAVSLRSVQRLWMRFVTQKKS